MKTYETVIILKPQLTDGEVAAFADKAKEFIVSSGGEIVSEEKLGRRRFSHDIAKNHEGFYLYMKFNAQTSFIKALNENLKLNQNVLRSSVMSYVEPKTKPVKKEAAPAAGTV